MDNYLRVITKTNWKGQEGERGQDLAEYALLLGLIALIVVAAVILLGGGFSSVYTLLVTELGKAF